MPFDPLSAPSLTKFNYDKKKAALEASGYVPSGIKCPQDPEHELLDVPGSDTKAAVNGVDMATIKVFCPADNYTSERFI